MKQEIKTPIIVVVATLVVGLVAWYGLGQVGNAGNLDQGQIKYTPGKPPWQESDPSKQGPGGAPGGGGFGATGQAPAAGGPPPGFTPPTVNNSGN
jgi:hypothetical protein